MKRWILPAFLGVCAMTCAKTWGEEPHVSKAVAHIKSVAGMDVSGEVLFSQGNNGVSIVADIKGLKPGLHGFHIHEKGDCSAADFSSVGGHFNPTKKKHGGPNSVEHHVGDLGNLEANASGVAHFEFTSSELSLNGENSIVGLSVIVHSDADDFLTQPTGNSGSKVGCGVIEAAK